MRSLVILSARIKKSSIRLVVVVAAAADDDDCISCQCTHEYNHTHTVNPDKTRTPKASVRREKATSIMGLKN